MYCGGELPSSGDTDPAALSAEARADKAKRARELLASLKPEARAMMPAEVLAKLEADSRLDEEPEPDGAPTPLAQGVPGQPSPPALPPEPLSLVPDDPPPPGRRDEPGPRLVYSATEPPRPASTPPATPFLDPTAILTARRPRRPSDLSSDSNADLPSANQEEGRGTFAATMIDALGRGGGPFGSRKAPWRLMLLPDPSYRAGLPWLRSRLARTVGIDLYTASQYLQRPLPTCLAAADSRAEFDVLLDDLDDANLRVAVLPRREWARGRLPRIVTGILDLDEDPLLFLLEEDEPVAVERDAIEVALFAEIHPVRESVRIERNRLGLPKKTARAGLEDRFTPYIAVDLLLKDEPRALRLRSSAFDFPALLGDDVQIAATLNMRTIIERVSPPGRAIEVDTGFRRVHVLPAPQEREEQGGMKAGVVPRRAVDFTEYSLLRGMGLHPG